jgi:cold shock CspA family protein
MDGRIVYLNEERGFAFVREAGRDKDSDVFAHVSQFVEPSAFGSHSLGRGVTFDIDTTPDSRGKLRAVRIKVLD